MQINERGEGDFAAKVAAAMNQTHQPLPVLSNNKVDLQLDLSSFSSQRSGNKDGSKTYFSLPVLPRDTLDQLCSGHTGLRELHLLFYPAKTAS